MAPLFTKLVINSSPPLVLEPINFGDKPTKPSELIVSISLASKIERNLADEALYWPSLDNPTWSDATYPLTYPFP